LDGQPTDPYAWSAALPAVRCRHGGVAADALAAASRSAGCSWCSKLLARWPAPPGSGRSPHWSPFFRAVRPGRWRHGQLWTPVHRFGAGTLIIILFPDAAAPALVGRARAQWGRDHPGSCGCCGGSWSYRERELLPARAGTDDPLAHTINAVVRVRIVLTAVSAVVALVGLLYGPDVHWGRTPADQVVRLRRGAAFLFNLLPRDRYRLADPGRHRGYVPGRGSASFDSGSTMSTG